MKLATYALVPLAAASLAACESQAERDADAAEDQIEQRADASAAAAGSAIAALGLTEAQLLDADLIAADGSDLGDIEEVRRDASGVVEGLLIEVEDSNPDRYVVIPVDGLTTRAVDDDIDLATTITMAEIEAMPDADLTQIGATPAAAPITTQ